MRCAICDGIIDKPVWNRDRDTWEDCVPCLEIIADVFPDEPDNAKEASTDDPDTPLQDVEIPLD